MVTNRHVPARVLSVLLFTSNGREVYRQAVRSPRESPLRMTSESRKRSIVDSALGLFATRGYDGTSIEDLGQAVGLTGSALYRHFSSKEEIFLAANELGASLMRDGLATAQGLPPEVALEVLLRTHATAAVRRGECIRMWERDRHNMPPAYRAEIEELTRRFRAVLLSVVELHQPELSPHIRNELVNVVMSVNHGAPIYSTMLSDRERIEFLIETNRSLINGPHAAK